MSVNWREILEKVARGELTAEQGAVLMGGGKPEAAGRPCAARTRTCPRTIVPA